MPSVTLSSPGVRLLDAAEVQAACADVLHTLNQTTGVIPAGVIGGGSFVTVVQSNSTPGTQTTRTAAQMYADDPTSAPTDAYTLRICNAGAGTLTLAGGAGVTVTGTATVATATFRDFNVTYGGTAQTPTVTITNIGTGTYS